MKKTIKCQICGKANTWQPENTYRPFCGERCKLIDLGEWASESRKIPGEALDVLVDADNKDLAG